MTEPSRNAGAQATPTEAFIQFWGDMGAHWGVPRTVTLVHALLFIEAKPMNTDDVMARLGISRGNASMTLRTLVEWGLASRTHNPTDRKDYFAADQDVWQLFVTVVKARKRREVEPLVGSLQAIADAAAASGDPTQTACGDRLAELIQFVRAFDLIAERLLAAGPQALEMLGAEPSRR